MDLLKRQLLKDYDIVFKELVPLPQDASTKTYDRVITDNNESFVLMHYPDLDNKFEKFIEVSSALIKNKISAPRILGYDKKNQLVILEDFGDISLNKYLQNNPESSLSIYKKIIDIMHRMQSIQEHDLSEFHEPYSKNLLLNELKITVNWYFPYIGIENAKSLTDEYLSIWDQVLSKLPNFNDVFVHRDFHVDNLFVVKNSIGVIDFQDCVFGNPIYDLVSLLDDARIDVSSDIRAALIQYYAHITEGHLNDITTAYNILGAQRNSRILGVFARKAMQGNQGYVKFMPRVKNYLDNNLKIPELDTLLTWHKTHLIAT
jgi:hypothetical protein